MKNGNAIPALPFPVIVYLIGLSSFIVGRLS